MQVPTDAEEKEAFTEKLSSVGVSLASSVQSVNTTIAERYVYYLYPMDIHVL